MSLGTGARELLDELNLDEELLRQSLQLKGVFLTSEEVKYFINKFKNFLNNISKDPRSNMQSGLNYYSDSNLLETLKLPQRKVEIAFIDIDSSIYEICNYDLTNCKIYEFDISAVDIFSLASKNDSDSLFVFGKSKKSFFNESKSSDNFINLTPEVKLVTYSSTL